VSKIVIAITNDIDKDRRMLRTVDALVQMGHEVEVICRKRATSNQSSFSLTKTIISTWFSKGMIFYAEFNLRLLFSLFFIKKDIILSVDSDTLLPCTFTSWIQRKPLVIDMHELFSEVPELAHKSFKKWTWKTIENVCIPRSESRYTVSPTIAQKLEKQAGSPFEVVRNVPTLNISDSQIDKRPNFTIAYLGVLNVGRGLEQLIQAIIEIPTVELLLIGDGDVSDDLKESVSNLNLTDRVHFTGWVDPSEVHELLQTAHLGVNLLDGSSESYYLSLANKYFDYIHAELPILSMNFPEYRRLNERHETSILLDDLNIDKIKENIEAIQLDQDKYKFLKNNCLTAKQIWNWKEESKRLKAIFPL